MICNMRKGRKQQVKTGAEMNWLYAKHVYCFLKNGKAVRKLKKQMNRRWRRELNEEMLEEVSMDMDGYPDETEFKLIEMLDCEDVAGSFNVLGNLFNACGSGSCKIYDSTDELGKTCLTLELHTGGWSGCESMIEHLQTHNTMFWLMYWYSETRGGHYVFKGR